MESIVLIWDYELVYKRIDEIGELKKYLILESSKKSTYNKLADKVFDKIVFVDSFLDREKMLETFKEINSKNSIKAILAPLERTVEVAGYLRTKLGVDGVNEEISLCCRDKARMKSRVSEFGILAAKYASVTSKNQLMTELNNIGVPVVIKPIAGSGTRSTYVINHVDEVQSILDKLDFGNKSYIVESFIAGHEYHCDSIVDNTGEVVFSSVGCYLHNCIQTINSDLPTGTVVLPTNNETAEKIKQMNREVIKALGIKSIVTHLEAFVSNDSIYFNEIAVRIGGGPIIGLCIEQVHGVNIYDAFVDVQVFGTYKQKDVKMAKYSGSVAFPTQKGRIVDISNENQFKDIPNIVKTKIFNKKGDILQYDKDSTAERTGYSIVNSDDYDSLVSTLKKMYSEFILNVENI